MRKEEKDRKGKNLSPHHLEILKSITSWAIEDGIFRLPAITIVKTWKCASLAIRWVDARLSAQCGVGVFAFISGAEGWARSFGKGDVIGGRECVFSFGRHGGVNLTCRGEDEDGVALEHRGINTEYFSRKYSKTFLTSRISRP